MRRGHARDGRVAPQGTRVLRERGAILVIALLVMAMLLMLATAVLSISSTEAEIARNAREAIQAFYIAETGLARIQRDLLAQYAVPYRSLCGDPSTFYNLTTTTVLITGESLGTPGQTRDTDGSMTCTTSMPNTAAYYPFSAGSGTWWPVPYQGAVAGGSYLVKVRNAHPPALTDPCPSCIDVQVTAATGTTTGATRQIEATFQIVRYRPPGEHALFVEGGVWAPLGSGAQLLLAGPVFTKGWSATYPGLHLGMGGGADQVVNYYKGMNSTLQGAVAPIPLNAGGLQTLDTTVRVYQGPIEISQTSASVGEATAGGAKPSVSGVYANFGVTGTPGPANVYADSVGRFDLPRELTTFPDLMGPYTGTPLPGGAMPSSHDAYLRGNSLAFPGSDLTIDSGTPVFSYPSGQSVNTPCTGSCIVFRPGQDGGPPTLRVDGIVWVNGNITLGGTGGDRLAAIRYKGKGTLYARTGPADGSPTGGRLQITADLLPSGTRDGDHGGDGGGDRAVFPTDHRLGLISAGGASGGVADGVVLGDSSGQIKIAASIFGNVVSNAGPYQVAGSVIARYFYLSQNGSIYYVPALADFRPPGMPGAISPRAASPYFVRVRSWRDVMP